MDAACTLCSNSNLKTVIDFGLQPPANRFAAANAVEEKHPLGLGYCQDCGTAQLTARMPFDAIRPRYSWLVYNEPEGHLDDVAQQLAKLPGMNPQSKILGITYKDQSTVDRLAKLNLPEGVCIAEKDFNCSTPFFGLETIQNLLRDSETISKIKKTYGTANMVLMRHIIEHTDNAAALLKNLKPLVAKDGYIVLELPDSEKIFKNANHAFIWEEHISYFTEQSLSKLAAAAGAELAWLQRYPYPFEDSLLVALRFSDSTTQAASNNDLAKTKDELTHFANKLELAKKEWRETLLNYKNKNEKVAVFGAGHLAVKFINFLGLSDLIDCVIDDNANKKDMRMPGSLLPILPSAELARQGIRVCISTLSPESEIKVRQKFSSYFEDGGIFLPAFNSQGSLA